MSAPWRTLARVDSAPLRAGDHVHLQGGATFRTTLAPYAGMTGTEQDPIVFGSYGRGRASLAGGVYLNSVSNLTFEHLDVTSAGKGVFSSANGRGVHGIVLQDLAISDAPLAGISSNNRSDTDWLIDGVRIARTGDSGIYFVGSRFTIAHSTITMTGLRPSIGYPRHGIYAAGPAPTIVDNTITHSSTSGISLRYQDALVEGNRISGGARGVSFEEQASSAGTTWIAYNSISKVTDSGIVVARRAVESFVVANNTIRDSGAYGMYFQAVTNLTLANNIVQVTTPRARLLSVRLPKASYNEHNNLWYGGSGAPVYWKGAAQTFAGYRNDSGRGLEDVTRNPTLGSNLVPTVGSPALDGGSVVVEPSLKYRALCDGRFFSFCGRAPDLGAFERGARSARLVRPANR
jgi:parallel beta helix pectate lyase-like protein